MATHSNVKPKMLFVQMRGVYINNNRLKVKLLVRNHHHYKICDK